jgi:uncharacterized protein DUF3570
LTEQRPDTRNRTDVMGSTVYHFTRDVLYLSVRRYWDDWNVRSETVDFKYRREIQEHTYVEPHLRFYTQTQASFFRSGLIAGDPLPQYATSDERLGALRTGTVGATLGFHLSDYPGEWTIRGEYIGQFGPGHPGNVVGVQREYDLFPTVNIGSLVLGYSISF